MFRIFPFEKVIQKAQKRVVDSMGPQLRGACDSGVFIQPRYQKEVTCGPIDWCGIEEWS